ncbi:oleosin S2-2-like [Dendrobium catenatum]|uniref:Oleosin n=1 Tax=Dendrobium catenatum TaxID=906689 RepID=A0A2I0VWN9_9ASPA|nr:oleosin S2-2-like [Dendrobium catenatum]PKU67831.1 Oleosin [Dendrobium catenatum]
MADQKSDLRHTGEEIKHYLRDKSPPASKAVAAVMLFPVGGFLLAISALTLVTTVVGLAVTTPLFFLFSPVLVPAAVVIALAVVGFLASGAFGLTAVTSLSWIVNYLRSRSGQVGSSVHEQVEYVKRRVGEAAGQVGQVGQKSKEVGHSAQSK